MKQKIGSEEMQEELKEIVTKMNKFSEKYKCELELETYESRYVNSNECRYVYKLNAVQPRKVIANA